jgi:hypothetical protein
MLHDFVDSYLIGRLNGEQITNFVDSYLIGRLNDEQITNFVDSYLIGHSSTLSYTSYRSVSINFCTHCKEILLVLSCLQKTLY